MKRYKLSHIWLFTFVLLVFATFTYGQNQQSNTLTSEQKRAIENQKQLEQKYNVKRGIRPPIDLENVPEDAYKKGVLIIKLMPYMEKSFEQRYMKAGNKGFVETGIKHFDEINKAFEVQRYTRTLDALYEIPNSDAVKKHRERHRAWGFHLLRKIEFNGNYDVIEAVRKFEALDDVEYAEPVYKKKIHANTSLEKNNDKFSSKNENIYINTKQEGSKQNFPNDEHYDKQYALPLIDASGAWEIETGCPDVIVAIVDGGIQYNHEDLEENMWTDIGPDGEDTNPHEHGTHVSGIAGAVTNNDEGIAGVAGGDGNSDSGIELMSIDIFQSESYTDSVTYKAQVYAADNDAVISNNSWGYTVPNVYQQYDLDGIDYFNSHGGGNVSDGGITIFAAGNEDDNEPYYPAYYGYDDSETLGAMAVASTNENDKKSSFSNYGGWIDISAPGSNIYSTIPTNDYAYMSGTSMAAPYVSGVAALVASIAKRLCIPLDSDDVWDILVSSAESIDHLNENYEGKLGSGRLNANQAIETIFPAISGPDPACASNATYSLNSLLSDMSVTWSATPSQLFTNTSGAGSTFSTAWDGSGSGMGTITATLSGDCGSVDIEKEIWVGSPDFSLSGESQIYTYGSSTVLVNWSSSGINYEGQGSPAMDWSYTGPLFDVKGDYRKADLMAGGRTGYGWVYGEATNQCGSHTEDFAYEVIEDSPYSLSVSPVPADYQMTVTIDEPTGDQTNVQSSQQSERKYYLYNDRYMLVKHGKIRGNTFQVSTNNLPEGFYFLKVVTLKDTYTRKLEIRH